MASYVLSQFLIVRVATSEVVSRAFYRLLAIAILGFAVRLIGGSKAAMSVKEPSPVLSI